LYETNYVRVRQSISKYRSEEAVAVDIFEDALLVFKKHALSGKFECFTVNKQRASISTYLVNVMNKLWLKQMTKDKRLKRLRSEYENDGMVLTLESLKEIDNQIEEYEAAKLIQEEIEKLDDNAKEILTRYLVHGEEAESIHPDYVERYQRIDSLRVFISRKVAKLKDSIKQLLDR
jgi:DNA-directed RNA polymerase specialized sigma24 family protein